MKSQTRILRIFSSLLLAAGLLLGLAFTAMATASDLESAIFVTGLPSDERLTSLRCPVVMTPNETVKVSAKISNSSDRARLRTVRAQISIGLSNLTREEETHFEQPAGDSRVVEWVVTPEDAVYGERMVLVQVHSLRNSPLPSEAATCGIMLVNLPGITGQQLLNAYFGITLAALTVGGGLWLYAFRPLEGRMARLAGGLGTLVAITLGGMVVSLMGVWILGIAAVLLTVLGGASIVGSYAR